MFVWPYQKNPTIHLHLSFAVLVHSLSIKKKSNEKECHTCVKKFTHHAQSKIITTQKRPSFGTSFLFISPKGMFFQSLTKSIEFITILKDPMNLQMYYIFHIGQLTWNGHYSGQVVFIFSRRNYNRNERLRQKLKIWWWKEMMCQKMVSSVLW